MINAYQGAPTVADSIDNGISTALSNVNTAVPAHVLIYDPATQRAQVQLSIKKRIGNKEINYAPCINVPVSFPGTANWSFFSEIKKGDEGLVIFSKYACDLWKQNGGLQSPYDNRKFSQSDAFFITGFRPDTQNFKAFPSQGIGITSKDNKTQVSLKDDSLTLIKDGASSTLTSGSIVTKIGGASVTITDSSITLIAGGQTVVIGGGGVIHNGVNIGSTHVHSQDVDSHGDKQVDTKPPH